MKNKCCNICTLRIECVDSQGRVSRSQPEGFNSPSQATKFMLEFMRLNSTLKVQFTVSQEK